MLHRIADSAERATDSAQQATESAQQASNAATKVGKSVNGLMIKGFGGVAATAIAIIIAIIGAAWNTGGRIGSIDQRLTSESALRKQQDEEFKARLDRLPTKDQVLTKERLTQFENAVNSNEFEDRCAKLTPAQKSYLGRQVQQGRLPPSFLCL